MNLAAAEPAWPAVFAIHPRKTVVAPALVAAFRGLATSLISDCMGRNIGALGLRAYHVSASLCGPALTVRVRPGDNLMIHKAIEMAEPGDVIVVDGSGDLTQALVGGIMRAQMIRRGIAGIVVNGAIRDVAEWQNREFPAFALGHVHRGPSKDGPGEINVSISCAGLLVAPGDLVVGDADGVVAIPADEVERMLPLVLVRKQHEERIRASIAAGLFEPERINSILRDKGCPD